MDTDARTSCLRAIRLVARSARLCASVESFSDQYKNSAAGAARMADRAAKYYAEMKGEHEPHERIIRVVLAALVEAQICVRQLQAALIDSDDLAMQAEKIERAVVRAEGLSTPPPPAG